MPISPFEKGKLKIAAHIREELERAKIRFESIHCKFGGIHTPRDTARFVVTVEQIPAHLDLNVREVEDCESIVAGDTWRKIAGFIERIG